MTIIFKRSILCLFTVFLFWPLAGSSKDALDSGYTQKKQEENIPQPAYEVELTITNVDVIVMDSNGNRVTGLRPENFELYEDGLLQNLTNFYEVKSANVFGLASDAENPRDEDEPRIQEMNTTKSENRIIFFFDNWHLHPINRNWVTGKLEHFIRQNFGEGKGNQGMVVFLDRRPEIIKDFTPSPDALIRGLNEVKSRSGEILSRMRTREDLSRELNRIATDSGSADDFEKYRQSMSFARSFVEEEMHTLSYAVKSLDAFMSYLSGIKGRKVLLYICDGLTINPGEEIFAFIEQAYPFGNARSEAMNYDATQTFKELTARSNANEISIYPINAEAFESGFDSADRDKSWINRSAGASLYKTNPAYKYQAFNMMAEQTGGNAVLSSGNIDSGLKTIENDLNYYYSLGYRSPHRPDGRYHSVSLKLVGVDKDYNLRIRKGYVKSSPEERISENVLARLFIPYRENPLAVQILDQHDEKLPNGKIKLELKLLIPFKNIALLPQQREYVGKIKVYVAFLDSKNFWSDPYELNQEIRIPEEDYEKARTRNYPYITELHLDPGRYAISIAISDTTAKATTYLQIYRDLRE
ncbi:MAG: VWA domain-containing protein [Candidatus Aminicenantes bacterium]|nr:VWA domain-containing protein [Candidatus Aminicenantes bacterium]